MRSISGIKISTMLEMPWKYENLVKYKNKYTQDNFLHLTNYHFKKIVYRILHIAGRYVYVYSI